MEALIEKPLAQQIEDEKEAVRLGYAAGALPSPWEWTVRMVADYSARWGLNPLARKPEYCRNTGGRKKGALGKWAI